MEFLIWTLLTIASSATCFALGAWSYKHEMEKQRITHRREIRSLQREIDRWMRIASS